MPRKEKEFHFIYKTTCLITSKFYIGMHSTNDLDDGYLGSGTILRRSIKKHGEENHYREILEFLTDRESLAKREFEIVNEQLLNDSLCMNLKLGGKGGGRFWSEEHREKNLKAWTAGGRNKLKALQEDIEWKSNFTESRKEMWKSESYRSQVLPNIDWNGRKHSNETKEKMSLSRKGQGSGNNNSQYGTCWITNGIQNKKIHRGDLIPEGWQLGRK